MPNQSATSLLRLLLFGSVAVPIALTVLLGWVTYGADYRDSLQEAVWTSGVAREHAARVFDTQELVIERVLDLIKGLDDDEIRSSESALHDGLQRILSNLSRYLSIAVTDRDGRLLLSSSMNPIGRDIDLSDREYFLAVKNAPASRFIGKVQSSRIDGRVFFGLAGSRPDEVGSFAGVVNVAISPTLFTSFYATLVEQGESKADGRVLTMVRDDGEVLARFPSPATPVRPVLRSSPLFAAIVRNPEHGAAVGHSIIDQDGPRRLFAYDAVQGYPLHIVAGRSLAAVFKDWRSQMLGYLAGIVPATVMLFCVTSVTIRRTRREQDALAQARQEMQRREVAEAALQRAQRLEAVGQLTGGIAHDFNNVLTIIVGNVDMMVRRADNPERVRRLGGNVLLAAKRVADVTDKLLAFSRRHVVRPEVVSVNQSLDDLQVLLSEAVSRSVEIVYDLSPEACPVRMDPGQFESALINLVVNARDAMPAGGRLTISTRRRDLATDAYEDAPDLAEGGYVSIQVRDTGAGMDEVTLAKAFEPFFTTKDVGKGTGLGLSQVYGFAKQAGGHVRLESVLGQGTCVEILLPRSFEEAGTEPLRADAVVPLRTERNEMILVVEDEPNLRDMAVESLQDLGYRTLAASDAAEALGHIERGGSIDLMFSDIVMPGGMDGIALLREARRRRPDLAVVLTSGYTDATTGAAIPDDVPLLRKPYMREELASEIARLLARLTATPV